MAHQSSKTVKLPPPKELDALWEEMKLNSADSLEAFRKANLPMSHYNIDGPLRAPLHERVATFLTALVTLGRGHPKEPPSYIAQEHHDDVAKRFS